MRRLFGTAILLSLSLSCASTGERFGEDKVRQLENDWNQSRIAGDARRVAGLLDENWTAIHVDGRIEHKNSYVADIASGGRHILSIEIVDQTILVDTPVALVMGEVIQRGFRRGELREGRLRYTHVWVRNGASWRMVRSQATEIKPQ